MKIRNEEELFNAIHKCKYFSNGLYVKGETRTDGYAFDKYYAKHDSLDNSYSINILSHQDYEFNNITFLGKILVKFGFKKESDYLETYTDIKRIEVGFIRKYLQSSGYYKRVDDAVLFKEFVEIVGNVYDLYLLDEKKKIEEKEKEELEKKKQDEFIFGVNE